jgi:hypothetical protein
MPPAVLTPPAPLCFIFSSLSLYVPHTAKTCDSPTYLTPDLCDEIPCTLSTSGAAA